MQVCIVSDYLPIYIYLCCFSFGHPFQLPQVKSPNIMNTQIDLFLSDLPLYSSPNPSRPTSLTLPSSLGPLFITSLGRARTNRKRGRPLSLAQESQKSSLDSTPEDDYAHCPEIGLERQNTIQRLVSSFPSPPTSNARYIHQ
jgi:hypothetical protein